MLAEAYDQNADYERTLHELRELFRLQGEHAAHLEPGRRLLAAPLAPMVQLGANEGDTLLNFVVEEREIGDDRSYEVYLEHINDNDDSNKGVYDHDTYTYTTNLADRELDEESVDEDGTVYTHEDWRMRIGAAVAWSIFESWYCVLDKDPSSKVQAAVKGDEAAQQRLKEWEENHKK